MNIALLTFEDIDMAAELHRASLPDTQSSRMGKSYVTFLYRVLLKHKNLHMLLTVKKNEKIIGVISITRDLKATQRIMSQSLIPSGLPMIISNLFSGRISLQDLVEKMKFERAFISEFPSPISCILTLFVEKTVQQSGLGKALVEAGEDFLRKHNVSELFVDTQQINSGALAFYNKVGFKKRSDIFDSTVLSKKI